MKNKLQWAFAVIILFGIGLFSSCYPNDDLTNSESDIVMTNYVDTVHFDRIKSYYLPDTILPIRDKDDTSKVDKNPYTEDIIAGIAKNLNAFGYQRIITPDTNNLPDVVVLASSVSSTTTSVWYPYYPGWGYPGYGWWGGYYPPYYGGGYVSSYTMGTLKINMLDPWNPVVVEGDTVMPVYWDATIHGLLQGSEIKSRINKNIDQAFEMSAYLKEGK